MPVPGEFDNDEPIKILEKVRSSKCSASKAHRIEVSWPIPRDALEVPSPPLVAVPLPVCRTQQIRVLPQLYSN
jgi:hypothetical protein